MPKLKLEFECNHEQLDEIRDTIEKLFQPKVEQRADNSAMVSVSQIVALELAVLKLAGKQDVVRAVDVVMMLQQLHHAGDVGENKPFFNWRSQMQSDITERKAKKGGLNCKPKGERPSPPKGQGTQPAPSDNNRDAFALCKRAVAHADLGINIPAGHPIIDDMRECTMHQPADVQLLQAKIDAIADKLFVCHFQSGSGGLGNLALIAELRELSPVEKSPCALCHNNNCPTGSGCVAYVQWKQRHASAATIYGGNNES